MRFFIAFAFVTFAAMPINGQDLVLAGAVQQDTQRFPDNEVPSRLSGSATGWAVHAGALFWTHVPLTIEWSDAGTIEDVRHIPLDLNGRNVDITSTFRHRTRTAAALGGYSHRLSSRVRMAYLAGVAWTSVGREFESNAAGLVLVTPSDPATSDRSTEDDRSWQFIAGGDAFIRLSRRFHLVLGVRAQRIELPLDTTGWSVRTLAGAGWAP